MIKKSFILYSDIRETFTALTDEEAGQLIKHILTYVNGIEPIIENRIVKILFETIKSQLIRDAEKKVFSFKQCYIFFTEEKSLEVTFYEYPALEDNNITKRCMIPAGRFDIAKWFRNSEFAFILKDGYNEFKIEKDEVYSYIRFHTNEKINFKQFKMNETLYGYTKACFSLQGSRLGALANYYNAFKGKKHIIREIKANLV